MAPSDASSSVTLTESTCRGYQQFEAFLQFLHVSIQDGDLGIHLAQRKLVSARSAFGPRRTSSKAAPRHGCVA